MQLRVYFSVDLILLAIVRRRFQFLRCWDFEHRPAIIVTLGLGRDLVGAVEEGEQL